MRKWLESVPCKMTMAQLVALCPSFGRKMADKIDDLTERDPHTVKSVAVAWHLPVTMHGHQLAALLDTGSSLTLIGEDCANRLGLQPTECHPITMKMANDTRAIATKYLPAACIKIGNLEVPARIIIMPGVNYDLLLGKDFLTATQARIGMDANAARATLTWNGVRQTFSLTDDIGEYGLIGQVDDPNSEDYDMEEEEDDNRMNGTGPISEVINPTLKDSRRPNLFHVWACQAVTTWRNIFQPRKQRSDTNYRNQLEIHSKEVDPRREGSRNQRNHWKFNENRGTHTPMATQKSSTRTRSARTMQTRTSRMERNRPYRRGKEG